MCVCVYSKTARRARVYRFVVLAVVFSPALRLSRLRHPPRQYFPADAVAFVWITWGEVRQSRNPRPAARRRRRRLRLPYRAIAPRALRFPTAPDLAVIKLLLFTSSVLSLSLSRSYVRCVRNPSRNSAPAYQFRRIRRTDGEI